ncbi:MAG: hypothetical protein N2203_08100 [Bacteroidia bacterium]|nr:hypothetical protein [Bacteroidia bacterium]
MKKIFFIYSFLFVGVVFLLYQCRKDKYVIPVCYDTDIQPIFTSKCTMSGCHNSTDKAKDLDLSSYDAAMASNKKDDILKVIQKGEMPPSGYVPLTKEEKQLITRWVEQGYTKGKCSDNNSTCDTSTVTYTNSLKSIFDTYCVGCHNSSNMGGGYALDTYSGCVSCANSGRLLGAVKWQTGYSAMPKNGSKLNDCAIAKIQKWINSGKPN